MKKSKTTTQKTSRTSAFRFKICITNGTHNSRKSWRELSYPTPPKQWTSADLLEVVRLMAREAVKVRRVEVTDDETTVWFSGSDGGTRVQVSPNFGAWAELPGSIRNSIPSAAIAGLVSGAAPQVSASMRLPNLLQINRTAFIKQQRRYLKYVEQWKKRIEARMAEMGKSGDDRPGA